MNNAFCTDCGNATPDQYLCYDCGDVICFDCASAYAYQEQGEQDVANEEFPRCGSCRAYGASEEEFDLFDL